MKGGVGLEPSAVIHRKSIEEVVKQSAIRDPRLAKRFKRMLEFVADRRHQVRVRIALPPVDADAKESIRSGRFHPHEEARPYGAAASSCFNLHHTIRMLDCSKQALKCRRFGCGSLDQGGKSRLARSDTCTGQVDEAVPVSEQPGQDLVALDDALQLLATVHPPKSSVVELRFFGGLSLEETAEALHVSVDTVKRDFRFAKLWLLRELREERPPDA